MFGATQEKQFTRGKKAEQEPTPFIVSLVFDERLSVPLFTAQQKPS